MKTRGGEAVVVGSGPNGLAAALTLAEAGVHVRVLEAAATPGGGCRSDALTLPGFVHDACAAIHPVTVASPFFRKQRIERHVEFVHSPAALAHPFDDGTAALLLRDVRATDAQLGAGGSWARAMGPLVAEAEFLIEDLLAPLLKIPRHPLAFARIAPLALLPATLFARGALRGARARALFAGLAAHSMIPLEAPGSAAFGLMLGLLGHHVGWPFPRGGAGRIVDFLVERIRALGGEVETSREVRSLRELPVEAMKFLDVTPRQFVRLAGDALTPAQARPYERFRYGPGVFKIDYALRAPIPWRARECASAATVHIGGSIEEIARSERDAWRGVRSERPFVLLAQHTLFDASRAPDGMHTAWAYCHVPHGDGGDFTDAIEAQIERFAPGFRDCIAARHTTGAMQMQAYNANYIGGDIGGGAATLWQTLARPRLALNPYRTPLAGVYLCSSSTPPGPGVHGMCGVGAVVKGIGDRG